MTKRPTNRKKTIKSNKQFIDMPTYLSFLGMFGSLLCWSIVAISFTGSSELSGTLGKIALASVFGFWIIGWLIGWGIQLYQAPRTVTSRGIPTYTALFLSRLLFWGIIAILTIIGLFIVSYMRHFISPVISFSDFIWVAIPIGILFMTIFYGVFFVSAYASDKFSKWLGISEAQLNEVMGE